MASNNMLAMRPLTPQLKPGAESQHSYSPGAFQTKKGRLLVPRQDDPPPPSTEVIKSARQGQLIDSLKEGRIYCSSDLIGTVSAQTAKISLDDLYDFQTRPLSPFINVPLSSKSLRNLFYIAINRDELPSYHFWVAPNDPAPILNDEPTDWTKTLNAEKKKLEEKDEGSAFFKSFMESSEPSERVRSLMARRQPSITQKPRQTFGFSDAIKQLSKNDTDSSEIPDSPSKSAGATPTATTILEASNPQEDEVSPIGTSHHTATNQKVEQDRTLMPPPSPRPQTQGFVSNSQSNSQSNNPSKELSSRKDSLLALAAKASKSEPRDTSVLIRSDRGGRYLKDFSTEAFKKLAHHMVMNEDNDEEVGSGGSYLDIFEPGKIAPHVVALRYGIQFDRLWRREIEPLLGLKGYHFRVRSDAYSEKAPWDNGKKGSLKITRHNVGYCYVNSKDDWSNSRANDELFNNALDYLFGPGKNQPDKLTLEIPPDHGAKDIDRSSEQFISREVGELLKQITKSSVSSGPFDPFPYCYGAEIFVHELGSDFEYPLIQRMRASIAREQEESEKERLHWLEQEESLKAGDCKDPAQPTNSQRWSIVNPASTIETLPSSSAYLSRPKIRTPSEIGDLERRLQNAEERVTYLQEKVIEQAEEIKRVNGERSDAEAMWRNSEDKNTHLQQQCSQMREQTRAEMRDQVSDAWTARDKLQRIVYDYENGIRESPAQKTLIQGLQEKVKELTEERDQLNRKLENSTTTAAEDTIENPTAIFHDHSGSRNTAKQETTAAAPEPRAGSAEPKKWMYCTICLKSVDKLDQQNKIKHAEKCATIQSSFAYLSIAEAKDLRASQKETKALAKSMSEEDNNANDKQTNDSEGEPSARHHTAIAGQTTHDGAPETRSSRKRKLPEKFQVQEQTLEPTTKRPKRNTRATAPKSAPVETTTATKSQDSAPVKKSTPTAAKAKEVASSSLEKTSTKATRTRARGRKASEPPTETIEADGDASEAETGPRLKRKARAGDHGETKEPDGDSSEVETRSRLKRKATATSTESSKSLRKG
ncbi:hypothetical protein ACLMJK_005950 [Lecanora helva]